MKITNLVDKKLASDYVAIELLKLIKDKPDAILGLATGGTMTDVYPAFQNCYRPITLI